MATLYHAPYSRSETVLALVRLIGADVEVREVSITRQDGGGGPDPDNPHPEKKVPYLVDGDEGLSERAAIMIYLTDAHPDAGLGPVPGAPGRGAYLSWMTWYAGVMEPVIVLRMAGIENAEVASSLRGLDEAVARLSHALSQGPWLLGQSFSAADILCASPFHWMPDLAPHDPAIRDWVARTAERMAP